MNFKNIYKYIALNFGDIIFVSLFNLRSFIKRNDTRVSFKKIDNFFLAKSSKFSRYFSSKEQTYNCFDNGLSDRAFTIGKNYHLDKIDFHHGDTIIDCGANIGDLKLYFEVNNLLVEYIGIEPSFDEFKCLEKNVYPSKVYNAALWSSNQKIDFYLSSSNADSSIFQPSKFDEITQVDALRADSIFSKNIRLLKLEAEGAEFEVLQGCSEILDLIEYISADLGQEKGVLEESTLIPVTNFLLKNGFEIHSIDFKRFTVLFKNNKENF